MNPTWCAASLVAARLARGAGDVGRDLRRVQVAYGDDEIVVTLADGAGLGEAVAVLMLEAPDFVLDETVVLVFRRANVAPAS